MGEKGTIVRIGGNIDIREGYQLDTGVLETAKALLEVNIAREASRHPVKGRRDIELLTA